MTRLVSCNNHYGVATSLSDVFDEVVVISDNTRDFDFKEGDVVLFGGGEDISPSIYKQEPSRYTSARATLSRRDEFEMQIYNRAVKLNIPMIGICRGAQLICAASGGSLYQHVTGHGGSGHNITTKEGTVLDVCSAHHQMMNPMGTKHDLIAWSTKALSHKYLIEKEKEVKVDVEPEIIYFSDVKGLAIQWHPEFMSPKDDAVIYAKQLIKQLFLE